VSRGQVEKDQAVLVGKVKSVQGTISALEGVLARLAANEPKLRALVTSAQNQTLDNAAALAVAESEVLASGVRRDLPLDDGLRSLREDTEFEHALTALNAKIGVDVEPQLAFSEYWQAIGDGHASLEEARKAEIAALLGNSTGGGEQVAVR
jgi:hypothetical protein